MTTALSLRRDTVDFSKTGLINPLVSAYLENDEKIRYLYSYEHSISSFAVAALNRDKYPLYRNELADALLAQNAPLINDFPLIGNNIERLRAVNCFTVTTGHQLCIFTGPLYFIYKIISVIRLAEELNSKNPDKYVVPVYWMASEDHDFAEINHIFLYNKKIAWDTSSNGPVGQISTESLIPVLEELKQLMGDSANAVSLYNIFREAYSGNETLAGATRTLVTRLFGKYGLVIIDGNDASLKKLFLPVMKEELRNHPSGRIVGETSEQLIKSGYKPQVNPREINLFYLDKGIRARITAVDGRYEVKDAEISFSADELFRHLEQFPERFSPNVVLRPVYEEYILPNIAYVGGPGEMNYWLQYKAMFEHFNVHYPVLVLRNRLLLIDGNMEKKMHSLGISATALFAPPEELIRDFIYRNAPTFDAEAEKQKLSEYFALLEEKISAIDPTLEASVAAERQKVFNSIEQLSKKVVAAMKRKHDHSVNQIRALKEKAFPNGIFQERALNFIPYYIRYGDAFFEMLMNGMNVMEKDIEVLYPDHT